MYSGDRAPGSKDTTTEGLDRPRRLPCKQAGFQSTEMVEGEGQAGPARVGWESHGRSKGREAAGKE